MVRHYEYMLVVLHVGVSVLVSFTELKGAVEYLQRRAHIESSVGVHLLAVGLVHRLPLQEFAPSNAAVANGGLKHLNATMNNQKGVLTISVASSPAATGTAAAAAARTAARHCNTWTSCIKMLLRAPLLPSMRTLTRQFNGIGAAGPDCMPFFHLELVELLLLKGSTQKTDPHPFNMSASPTNRWSWTANPHIHTHTHTRTHTHTYTYAHTHAHMHTPAWCHPS